MAGRCSVSKQRLSGCKICRRYGTVPCSAAWLMGGPCWPMQHCGTSTRSCGRHGHVINTVMLRTATHVATGEGTLRFAHCQVHACPRPASRYARRFFQMSSHRSGNQHIRALKLRGSLASAPDHPSSQSHGDHRHHPREILSGVLIVHLLGVDICNVFPHN